MTDTMKTVVEDEGRTQIEAVPETCGAIPVERPPMAAGGLCATCAEAPHCLWLRDCGPVMISCEEFRVATGPRLTLAAAVRKTSERPVDQSLGLCATCERAETCVLRRPEGGVWFCEEFE